MIVMTRIMMMMLLVMMMRMTWCMVTISIEQDLVPTSPSHVASAHYHGGRWWSEPRFGIFLNLSPIFFFGTPPNALFRMPPHSPASYRCRWVCIRKKTKAMSNYALMPHKKLIPHPTPHLHLPHIPTPGEKGSIFHHVTIHGHEKSQWDLADFPDVSFIFALWHTDKYE